MEWIVNLKLYRKRIILVVTPVILLFILPMYPTKAGRCAYGIGIMVIYWMTDTLPIGVTSLMPIPLFSWLGIITARDVARNYFSEASCLMMTGLLIAVAIEKWNLHKRIALKTLLLMGHNPQMLLLAFMITTTFLSMWLVNTATAAMLIPIAHAVMQEVHQYHETGGDTVEETSLQVLHPHPENSSEEIVKIEKNKFEKEVTEEDKKITGLHEQTYTPVNNILASQETGLKIAVAYSASFGGMATLTGSSQNVVLKGLVERLYPDATEFNYGSWMLFAVPNMVICLMLSWIWMVIHFIGPRALLCGRKSDDVTNLIVKRFIEKEYKKIGPMRFAEVLVTVIFMLTALLWLTRNIVVIPGLGFMEYLKSGYITDGSIGMALALLLFVLPSERCGHSGTDSAGPSPPLLDWQTVQHNFPWCILLLLGGTLAIADACLDSGLSQDIGSSFNAFVNLPDWAIAFILTVITATFTEFTSATAACAILLPIIAKVAESNGIHPFYLILPVTLSASMSFMLPIATPPNAIVFAYGHTKIMDMVKSGVVMNVVCILILQLSLNTYGYKLFNMGTYPDWAPKINSTAVLSNATSSN